MLRLAPATAVVAAVMLASSVASAQRAQMYLSQAPIPARLSEQGLRGFMRGHAARQINEESDHQTWKFKVGTFFNSSPGDLECHLLFYDVEHGSRLFVTEMAVFLSNREETAFLQNVTLNRPQFKPQNRYIVVLTVRRNEMASANFELVGRPIYRSGQVEFSDEETQDPDQMSAQQQQAAAEAQRIAIEREQARQREYEQALREQQAEAHAGGGGGGDEAASEETTEGGEEELSEEERAAAEEVHLAGENTPQSGGCASCSAASRGPSSGPLASLAALCVCLGLVARRRRDR